MIRKIVAVVVGLLAGFIVVSLGLAISMTIFPPPEGIDTSNEEQMRAFIKTLPPLAFFVVLLSQQAGSFAAGAVCALIARRWYLGVVILGVLYLLAGIVNLTRIPHPLWFAVADVLLYLPSALLGGFLVNALLPPRSTNGEISSTT